MFEKHSGVFLFLFDIISTQEVLTLAYGVFLFYFSLHTAGA